MNAVRVRARMVESALTMLMIMIVIVIVLATQEKNCDEGEWRGYLVYTFNV